MAANLVRRCVAEAVATSLLVAIVVGSGIAADRLAPDAPAIALLANATATAGGLFALVVAFGPISGAQLNPVVTLAGHLLGRTTTREALAYVGAQFAGAITGVMAANAMFDLAPVALATTQRSSAGVWLGEVIATFGLVTVVLAAAADRVSTVAAVVAGYLGAGYWFTSSTSFANPAVTAARTLTDTFTGIAPSSAPAFVAAQLVGGLAAAGFARFLRPSGPARRIAVPDRVDVVGERAP